MIVALQTLFPDMIAIAHRLHQPSRLQKQPREGFKMLDLKPSNVGRFLGQIIRRYTAPPYTERNDHYCNSSMVHEFEAESYNRGIAYSSLRWQGT
jgi:hypothetical protein